MTEKPRDTPTSVGNPTPLTEEQKAELHEYQENKERREWEAMSPEEQTRCQRILLKYARAEERRAGAYRGDWDDHNDALREMVHDEYHYGRHVG